MGVKKKNSTLRPATSLEELLGNIKYEPEPLCTPEELEAFYRSDLNQVRGDDWTMYLKSELLRSHGADFYRAFFMGHSGTGKSTELYRLTQEIENKYC